MRFFQSLLQVVLPCFLIATTLADDKDANSRNTVTSYRRVGERNERMLNKRDLTVISSTYLTTTITQTQSGGNNTLYLALDAAFNLVVVTDKASATPFLVKNGTLIDYRGNAVEINSTMLQSGFGPLLAGMLAGDTDTSFGTEQGADGSVLYWSNANFAFPDKRARFCTVGQQVFGLFDPAKNQQCSPITIAVSSTFLKPVSRTTITTISTVTQPTAISTITASDFQSTVYIVAPLTTTTTLDPATVTDTSCLTDNDNKNPIVVDTATNTSLIGTYDNSKVYGSSCAQFCYDNGYEYFAVSTTRCYCGDDIFTYSTHTDYNNPNTVTFSSGVVTSSSNCAAPCPGSTNESCGSPGFVRFKRTHTSMGTVNNGCKKVRRGVKSAKRMARRHLGWVKRRVPLAHWGYKRVETRIMKNYAIWNRSYVFFAYHHTAEAVEAGYYRAKRLTVGL